ncbi:TonB-dependent receptor [Ostertagia ostertagi]
MVLPSPVPLATRSLPDPAGVQVVRLPDGSSVKRLPGDDGATATSAARVATAAAPAGAKIVQNGNVLMLAGREEAATASLSAVPVALVARQWSTSSAATLMTWPAMRAPSISSGSANSAWRRLCRPVSTSSCGGAVQRHCMLAQALLLALQVRCAGALAAGVGCGTVGTRLGLLDLVADQDDLGLQHQVVAGDLAIQRDDLLQPVQRLAVLAADLVRLVQAAQQQAAQLRWRLVAAVEQRLQHERRAHRLALAAQEDRTLHVGLDGEAAVAVVVGDVAELVEQGQRVVEQVAREQRVDEVGQRDRHLEGAAGLACQVSRAFGGAAGIGQCGGEHRAVAAERLDLVHAAQPEVGEVVAAGKAHLGRVAQGGDLHGLLHRGAGLGRVVQAAVRGGHAVQRPGFAHRVAPETRTYSLLGKVTALLPQDWTLSVAASVLGSRATQVGLLNWVSPEGGITTFNFGPNRQNPQPTVLNGTNVIDPATGSPVDHEFSDLPAQRSQTSTQSQRLVAELSGTVAGWDLNATLGLTRVATDLTLKNFVSLPALQAALNSGKYVIGGSNPPSVLSSLTPEGRSTSTNTLNFVSLRASRDLMKLGGGNLALGTGVEFTKRSLDERFPEGFSSGAQASNIYAFGVGKQTITAAYVELAAPLTKQLEIDAAARIDHYDTYGSSVTPKVGIKYVPVKELTLRGTYAGGFRAPNPVEIGTSGSSAGYLPPLVDTALCNFVKPGQPCDIGVGGTQLQLPGKDLRPEKSRSMTIGFIFEPVPTMNISVDYYDIRIRNQIVSVGLFGQGQIDTPEAYGTKLYRVNSPTTPNAAPTSADDTILYGTYPFINLGSARTSGVDVDLRMKLNAGAWGEFTPQLQWSHMIRYTIDRGPGQVYEMAGTHGPSFVSTNTGTPKDRASLGLAWARGPVELSGTLNYISGMKVEDSSYNLPDCASALSTIFPNGLPAGGSPLCRVPSFTTFNLNASWQLTPGLTLRASVTNLFDRAAPIDAFASGSTGGGVSSGGAHYNPSLHQEGAVGRYLTVGASWRF